MKRLAAIALLLALAAPLRADRIAVAVTVTNPPTHGLTFTLNGSTRTWTTNAPSSTQMRISATNSVSATNFYASLAANPFSGRVTIAQTSSNTVTLYGADGQAMVASLPSTSWGFYTATTNATTPGSITRADYAALAGQASNATYATTANTASNATDALALALTNGFVKATITNGLTTASVTNGILSSANSYADGASGARLSTNGGTVNGPVTITGAQTNLGAMVAAGATATGSNNIANVGALDGRLRRRININYGNGGSVSGNANVASSNALYSTFNGGYGFLVPPHYTKVVSYTYSFQRSNTGGDLTAGLISVSPAIGSPDKYSGSIGAVKLLGMGTIAGIEAMTNSAFVISLPALGTGTTYFNTNVSVNQSIRNNVTADGFHPWTNGYLFAYFSTINAATFTVTGLWATCTVVLEEED